MREAGIPNRPPSYPNMLANSSEKAPEPLVLPRLASFKLAKFTARIRSCLPASLFFLKPCQHADACVDRDSHCHRYVRLKLSLICRRGSGLQLALPRRAGENKRRREAAWRNRLFRKNEIWEFA